MRNFPVFATKYSRVDPFKAVIPHFRLFLQTSHGSLDRAPALECFRPTRCRIIRSQNPISWNCMLSESCCYKVSSHSCSSPSCQNFGKENHWCNCTFHSHMNRLCVRCLPMPRTCRPYNVIGSLEWFMTLWYFLSFCKSIIPGIIARSELEVMFTLHIHIW